MHRMRFLKGAFVTSVQLRCLRMQKVFTMYVMMMMMMMMMMMRMYSLSSPAYPIGVCYAATNLITATVASPSYLFNIQLAQWRG